MLFEECFEGCISGTPLCSLVVTPKPVQFKEFKEGTAVCKKAGSKVHAVHRIEAYHGIVESLDINEAIVGLTQLLKQKVSMRADSRFPGSVLCKVGKRNSNVYPGSPTAMTYIVATVIVLQLESEDVVLPITPKLAEFESIAAIHRVSRLVIEEWLQGWGSSKAICRVCSYLHEVATPSQVSPKTV